MYKRQLADLASTINNTLTYPLLTNTVAASGGADTLTLTMTGGASEELRIRTDDELRVLEVGNNWDISGTDWVYLRLIFNGDYTDGFGHAITITTDPATPH